MSLRSTIISCLTAVTCVSGILAYTHKYFRYSMVGNENSVFILDRQTTLIQHCNKDHCSLVTPQGVTVDMLRQMAGVPNPSDALSSPPQQACQCPQQSAPTKDPLLASQPQITSFQMVDPLANKADNAQLQQKSAADIGMKQIAQPMAPNNPFPSVTPTSSSTSTDQSTPPASSSSTSINSSTSLTPVSSSTSSSSLAPTTVSSSSVTPQPASPSVSTDSLMQSPSTAYPSTTTDPSTSTVSAPSTPSTEASSYPYSGTSASSSASSLPSTPGGLASPSSTLPV